MLMAGSRLCAPRARADYLFAASLLLTHLSRMAEDLIFFSSDECGFGGRARCGPLLDKWEEKLTRVDFHEDHADRRSATRTRVFEDGEENVEVNEGVALAPVEVAHHGARGVQSAGKQCAGVVQGWGGRFGRGHEAVEVRVKKCDRGVTVAAFEQVQPVIDGGAGISGGWGVEEPPHILSDELGFGEKARV